MGDYEKNISSMNYRIIYDRILKSSRNGYVSQNVDIGFDYSIDCRYMSEIKRLMELSGFENIQSEDEIETFRNATNWVSQILLSDKEAKIEPVSSYELISKVKEGAWAANCYAHAVVLNDVFHLLGYKGRYVFCMPVDYHFTDNHVVNLVYSKQLRKWVLFDAAQNLYYTDDAGTVLDICELRKYFIEDKPIHVELLDAYWSELKKKESIMFQKKVLIYMMKNVYRFHCFQNSIMDRLAKEREIIHYHLVPINYMSTPFIRTFYDIESAVKHKEIYSSDEDKFWKTPEEGEI